MIGDFQQAFYEEGYGEQRVGVPRWRWLDPWFPAAPRVEVAAALLPGGERVLDVGCGGGGLLRQVRDRYKDLCGVDIAPVQIARARETLGNIGDWRVDLRVVNIDACGLAFEDSYFDAVACISVLPFLFDVDRALAEINRVLKIGGLLVVQTNNLAYAGHRLSLLIGRQPRTSSFHGWDGNTLHYFVLRSLEALLRGHGFVVLWRCCAGRFNKIRSLWPSLLGGDLIALAKKVGRPVSWRQA